MLLNGNCSWSYKSLKVMNHKMENNSNGSPQIMLQNKVNISVNRTSCNRVANVGKDKPGNSNMKRKFFDLVGDSSPEVSNFAEDNSYDFDEMDQVKTTKKPRKRIVKKKSKKDSIVIDIKPKKSRIPRSKKKVDYVEWNSDSELGSVENDFKMKSQFNEQEVQTRLDQEIKINKLQFNDEVKELKKEKLKPYSDKKMSPLCTNGSENADDESDCSDEGFVFQTRFSDKNAKVVDVKNSIESDSLEVLQQPFEVCDNSPTFVPKLGIENEEYEEMRALGSPEEGRTSSVDHSLNVVYTNKFKEENSNLESENSFLSSSDVKTDLLHLEEKSIEVGNELKNEELPVGGLEGHTYEKCKKINQETKQMYDRLENEIFQSNEEFKTTSFEVNMLKEVEGDYQVQVLERKALEEKYGFENKTDYVKSNSSKQGFNKKQLNKINLCGLTEEKNIKPSKSCNDNRLIDMTNLRKSQHLNEVKNKPLCDLAIKSRGYSNPDESFGITKKKNIHNDFLSDHNDHSTERSNSSNSSEVCSPEINNSAHASNSSEICSPEIELTNSLTDCFNIKSRSLSANNSEKRLRSLSSSKENRNISNQCGNSIQSFSNEQIDLKQKGKIKVNTKEKEIKNTTHIHELNQAISKSIERHKNEFNPIIAPNITDKRIENKLIKAEENSISKPKTWDDLEAKLLMDIDNNMEETSMQPVEDDFFNTPIRISNTDADNKCSVFREEKRELKIENFLEISQYRKSKRVITSKKNFSKKCDSNKQIPTASNQVSVLESPSVSILNKTIAAMNRSTAEYFAKNEVDSSCSRSESSNNVDVQGTEYSFSILSATIQTSNKKLNLSEKRSIQNINDSKSKLIEQAITTEGSALNNNIFSMAAKAVVTSNYKVTNKKQLKTKSPVKYNKTPTKSCKTKVSRRNNKSDDSLLSLKYNGHSQLAFENDCLNLDSQDESIEDTHKIDDSSDSKHTSEKHYNFRRSVADSNKRQANLKKQNMSVLKEKKTAYFHDSKTENKATLQNNISAKGQLKTKRSDDSKVSDQSEKRKSQQLMSNLSVKQPSSKDAYIKYLKNLFQNDALQETEMHCGEVSNDELSKSFQNESGGAKFFNQDDDLFSISSDDFEKEETGYYSEASGLFYDVLDED